MLLLSCNNSQSRDSIDFRKIDDRSLLDSLAGQKQKDGVLDTLWFGTRQKKYYKEFTRRFGDSALIALCNHNRPVIRWFAFKTLADSCNEKIFDILKLHLSDTTSFHDASGEFSLDRRLIDAFLGEVGLRYNHAVINTLTSVQTDYVDSVLLYSRRMIDNERYGHSKFRFPRQLLWRLKPLPQYHERVKEIASCNIFPAMRLLASYQCEEDIPMILKSLQGKLFSTGIEYQMSEAREAIKNYPHPAFYPVLKQQMRKLIETGNTMDSRNTISLLSALACYPTIETRRLFEKLVEQTPEENKSTITRYISESIKEDTSGIFEGLIN